MPSVDVANLGSNTNPGGNTTLTITTTSAVAAGARLCVGIAWWDDVTAGQATITGFSDNSGAAGSWTTHGQAYSSNNADATGIGSRVCPNGLASGIVITITFNQAVSGGNLAIASSFLGVDPGAVDVMGTINLSSGTSFTLPSVTTTLNDDLIFGVIGLECATSSTTTWSTGTKIADAYNVTAAQGVATGYRLTNTAGSNNMAGTVSPTSTASPGLIVAFKGLATTPVFPSDIGFGFSEDFGPFGVDTGFPFVLDPYPPTLAGGPLVFDMGSVNAVLTLAGIVPSLRARAIGGQASVSFLAQVAKAVARLAPGASTMNLTGIIPTKELITVKPPVATLTLAAQNPAKFIVREPFSPVATLVLSGIAPLNGNVPVVFNMGTTRATLNLNGIVPTKLVVRANSAVASLSLAALPPVDRFFVHPIVASLNVSATVPALRIRSQLMPQASLSLSAQVPQRPITKVSAPTAILRFTATSPFDPTTNPIRQFLLKALDKGRSSSSSEQISR